MTKRHNNETAPPLDPLDELRSLLLEQDRERIEELEKYRSTPSDRAKELAQLIPPAMEQAIRDGGLNGTLAEQIQTGLSEAIRRDATGIAKVLFPIMGPSIRRAAVESLRDFLMQMNGAVYNTVTGQNLKWRFEALRTGRKYRDVVLERTLRFQVEQVLLIQANTGLLAAKAELKEVVAKDVDSFSAMLTAIQDFVSDSMDGDTNLSTIEMGERTIWIIRGPEAHLACVVNGVPSQELRRRLAEILDTIHIKYADALSQFCGDPTPLHGIGLELERCLTVGEPAKTRSVPLWPVTLIVIAMLAAFAHTAFYAWTDGRALKLAFADEPGFVIVETKRRWGHWSIQGLADPMARPTDEILSENNLAQDDVQFDLQPFLSLDPRLIEQRARIQLSIPAVVSSELSNGMLTLAGIAPDNWVSKVSSKTLPLGIERLDLSQILREKAWNHFRTKLPGSVTAEFNGKGIVLRGEAPLNQLASIPNQRVLSVLPPVIDVSQLIPTEWKQATAIQSRFNSKPIYFYDLLNLSQGENEHLLALEQDLSLLVTAGKALGLKPRLSMKAHSDGLGSKEQNQQLRQDRVTLVTSRLMSRHSRTDLILSTAISKNYDHPEQANPKLRRVDLKVSLPAPPNQWIEFKK